MATHRDYALLGHLDSRARYSWFFEHLREEGKEPVAESRMEAYLKGMPPSRVAEILPSKGPLGAEVAGCYIDCYFDPADLGDLGKQRNAVRKVEGACRLAAKLGVKVATLGGFTSILGELAREPLKRIEGTAFTTGNTLTAWAVLQGTLDVARRKGIDIEGARVVVIGASGDIGSGCVRWLNGRVRHLDLVARNLTTLQAVAGALPKTRTAIETHLDLAPIAPHADVVISVASTLSSAFDASIFPARAIICDAGFPKNVTPPPGEGPVVFYGGMVKLPFVPRMEPDFMQAELYPGLEVTHGCLGEGVLLALAGRYEPYSTGRGNITPERIDELGALAQSHGLSVAEPHHKQRYLFR